MRRRAGLAEETKSERALEIKRAHREERAGGLNTQLSNFDNLNTRGEC
jgi:hypothetical protein